MKFIFILGVLALFYAFPALATENCLAVDWMYNLHIGSLDINKEKLADFCSPETCTIESGVIAVRSHFAPSVAIILGDSEMIVRMPYQMSKLGVITSSLNLDEYDWKTSVKIDLGFLKHNGILDLESGEIAEISELSASGKNIFYCQGAWKQLEKNCNCLADIETCFDCQGALPLSILLPQNLLAYDLEPIAQPSPEPTLYEEQNEVPVKGKPVDRTLIYYSAVILLTPILIIIIRYAKRKKIPGEKNL